MFVNAPGVLITCRQSTNTVCLTYAQAERGIYSKRHIMCLKCGETHGNTSQFVFHAAFTLKCVSNVAHFHSNVFQMRCGVPPVRFETHLNEKARHLKHISIQTLQET